MTQIFISYSRKDREFADELARELEESGFQVWIDREDITGGSKWRAAITRAIRNAKAFLVVLSPSSTSSKNVARELELAADNECPVVPVICEPCQVPAEIEYHLAGIQRIDFTELGRANAIEQLIDALKQAGDPQSNASRAPPPVQPQYVPAYTPPRPLQLFEILAGRWNVAIRNMMGGVGNMTLDLAPNGMFQGQLVGPLGGVMIQGQWQIAGMNQIVLQGQETNGFLVGPYGTVIQVNQFGPQQIAGVTAAGEQVFWQKIG